MQESKQEHKTKLAVVSDIHLMAPSLLIAHGKAFERVLESDRKLLIEGEAILEQFIQQILVDKPEILLVPGDLTKDGEYESHALLAEKFSRLQEAGIEVFVIPGNHDINNPHARLYDGDHHRPTRHTTPDDFKEIYSKVGGYASPHLVELGPGLCYLVEPKPGLWILAMDSCKYDTNFEDNYPFTGGLFTKERLDWIEQVLKRGKAKGKRVLGMMHHGILEHFPLQTVIAKDYLVKNWVKVATLFANNGLQVVFTGHFHAQDVVAKRFTQGQLYDVETGSIVTYPCPYRLMTLTASELQIETSYIELQSEVTDHLPLQEYAYSHLKEGLPEIINYLISYVQKFYPGKLDDLTAQTIRDMVPHFTPLIMDIYTGHLKGDEVGLRYSDDPKNNPMSGDLLDELQKYISLLSPQYAPYFTLVEGALHSPILQDNNLTIPLQ